MLWVTLLCGIGFALLVYRYDMYVREPWYLLVLAIILGGAVYLGLSYGEDLLLAQLPNGHSTLNRIVDHPNAARRQTDSTYRSDSIRCLYADTLARRAEVTLSDSHRFTDLHHRFRCFRPGLNEASQSAKRWRFRDY